MCVEGDGCEIEGCSSSDEVRTLSGSMSPALNSSPDLHPCKPGHKFRAALLRCRSPAAAAGILSFGNVLNYMDRYTVAGRGSGMEKAPPPAHCGHMAREESSRSGARRPQSSIFA
uniref:SPNS lysolipid transporter 2, sphingosine-1-phosphate n=1 Tax=Gasterosteus aculeatus aculeatus TaxID=481459 RepID=A0AAQ4PH05_GASAC